MSLIKNARAVKTPCNHNYLFGAYHKSQVMRGGHSLYEWCFLKHCCVVLYNTVSWSCFLLSTSSIQELQATYLVYSLFTHCYTTTVMWEYNFLLILHILQLCQDRVRHQVQSRWGSSSEIRQRWGQTSLLSLPSPCGGGLMAAPLQHDSFNLILIKYCNNAGSSCCSHD